MNRALDPLVDGPVSPPERTQPDVHPEVGGARILALIGRGPDGASYLARSDRYGDVEVWRLAPQAVTPSLRRSVTALSTISSEAMLPIHAAMLDDRFPFLIVGRTSRDPSEGWELSAAALRERAVALAGALGEAHRLDVRGALGPRSVGIDPEGRARLDPTGLRVRQEPEPTPPPELADGGPPDAAGDVWTLGAILSAAPAANALEPTLRAMRDPAPERRPRALEVARALSGGPAESPRPADAAPKSPPAVPPTRPGSGGAPNRGDARAAHQHTRPSRGEAGEDEAAEDESEAERFGLPSHLGAYELIEQIGAGGMGRVFRARDVAGGPDVAVKILLPGWARDPELVERFRREARLLSRNPEPLRGALHRRQRRSGLPFPGDGAGPGRERRRAPRRAREARRRAGLGHRLRRGPRALGGPRARVGAPRHQAGEPPGQSDGRASRGEALRLRHRPLDRPRARRSSPATPCRARPRSWRPSRSRAASWTRGPTSTRSAPRSTVCSPASRRSPGRERW